MHAITAQVIAPDFTRGPVFLSAAGAFDARRAREAFEALAALCERHNDLPRRDTPAQARDELSAYGCAIFELLGALAPGAAPDAVGEAAQAMTLLYAPARLNLERAPATILSMENAS